MDARAPTESPAKAPRPEADALVAIHNAILNIHRNLKMVFFMILTSE
jgi:hypothetical protein